MAEKPRLNIGSKLRQLRESKGLEIIDVAKILGMKRERYNHYEVDAREPNLDTVVRLANFYNVSVDYLLGVTDIPTKSTPKGNEVSFSELLTKIYFQIDEETKHQLMDTMCKFINQIGREVKPLDAGQLEEAKKLKFKYATDVECTPQSVQITEPMPKPSIMQSKPQQAPQPMQIRQAGPVQKPPPQMVQNKKPIQPPVVDEPRRIVKDGKVYEEVRYVARDKSGNSNFGTLWVNDEDLKNAEVEDYDEFN